MTFKHHPPHIFLDNTWYLVSAATSGRSRLLEGDAAKSLVRDTIRALAKEFDVNLRAWVILDNHYHLLLKTKHGEALPRFIKRLHGGTARELNRQDNANGRQVWHNYWDTCIRTESDLWTRFNYIHQNPVKHGYVRQLGDWVFSSYGYFVRTKGRDWLADCWERYPVVDFLEGDDY